MYGLPGCGKTTVRTQLNAADSGYRCCYINDMTARFMKKSLVGKLRALPLREWWLLLRCLISLPLLPRREWNIYRGLFVITLAYRLRKEVAGYDYMVIDHGLVQSTVSLLYGHANSVSEKSAHRLAALLKRLDVEFVVYCKMTPELSLDRIRRRNRLHGDGRLDVIADDVELMSSLRIQYGEFETLASTFSKALRHATVINMDDTREAIVSKLKTIISTKDV